MRIMILRWSFTVTGSDCNARLLFSGLYDIAPEAHPDLPLGSEGLRVTCSLKDNLPTAERVIPESEWVRAYFLALQAG